MPKVSVVIVSMNRPDNLFPCLDSIRAHTSVSYETLVVAYLFTPENLASLKEKYPWVTVIESNELRGFSENNNLALRQVTGEYCFIVNDDTLMKEPVIDRLVAAIESLPDSAAAVSPCIRFADGSVQTCGRSRWTAWRYAKHYLHLVNEGEVGARPGIHGHPRPCKREGPAGEASGRGLSEAKAIQGCAPTSHVYQTYTLNGACFLIKTEAFRKAGWFDERYFFTPEDIALGHTLNSLGYTVWAVPDVSITHLAGGSVGAMEAAIKPTRVRGSMIFYGEPLWLKCFIWCVEAFRYYVLRRKAARNVMEAVFSKLTPKEIFMKFRP